MTQKAKDPLTIKIRQLLWEKEKPKSTSIIETETVILLDILNNERPKNTLSTFGTKELPTTIGK